MSETVAPILSILAGAALGSFFFVGLWWTIRRALSSRQPALLMMGSMLGRTGLVLLGFYVVADGQWQGLLFCLAGFIAARLIITRILPESRHAASPTGRMPRHAP